MMRLALDTSSLACSVALQIGERIYERHEERPREHTRLLVPMIKSVLDEAAVTIDELEAVVLGNGPGSFIGLRIAASVAQGLAHGAGIPIMPVSSLAAVAAEVFDTCSAERVVVAQDAHMSEIYLGIYRRTDDKSPAAICDERLQRIDTIVEMTAELAPGTVIAGAGWQRYPELLAAHQSRFNSESPLRYPRAANLLKLSCGVESISPEAINPAYLRKKVAEKAAPSRT